MSEPYIGEIKFVAFNFAPQGYALCNGQLLAISQNQALFSILGTTYGGNGTTNFALPNLQGRVPVHWGQFGGLTPINLGELGGEITHTLTITEMPFHNHTVMAANQAQQQSSPVGAYLPNSPDTNLYNPSANTTMIGTEIGNTGGSQSHNNMQPYTVINAIIALVGIFPPRN